MNTLQAAADALAAGRISARALAEEALARIAAPEGQGKAAFITVYEEAARAQADAMDALRRAGRAPSAYAGIPISIKDLFDVAGETTRAGSRVLAEAAAAQTTAPAIARLIAAGFVLVGRTNMTEFAFSGLGINPHYGTPLSPYARGEQHIPGGSSSGAAVSVADGMCLGAIGTDTGGSCRIPAAFCGITGFKPTQARVPLAGALPLAPTLDSIGPLANSASCCAVLDAVMAGEALGIPPARELHGMRLVLPENFAFEHLDAATERALDAAIPWLERQGVVVERRHMACLDAIADANSTGGFAAAEAFAWHETLLRERAHAYDPRVASRILPGGAMPVADYIRLQAVRLGIIRQFEAEMQGFDSMVLPTTPIAPPKLAAFADDAEYRRLNFLALRNPSCINFLDGCAISLPCHGAGAAPAGLMLAAPGFRDAALLGCAISIQRALQKR